jgi:hypothetical protein
MAKQLVTHAKLEELLLARVKTKAGCEKAHWLQIAPRVGGTPNWTLSAHDKECGLPELMQAVEEIAAEYELEN